jgi:hypothetical protein
VLGEVLLGPALADPCGAFVPPLDAEAGVLPEAEVEGAGCVAAGCPPSPLEPWPGVCPIESCCAQPKANRQLIWAPRKLSRENALLGLVMPGSL